MSDKIKLFGDSYQGLDGGNTNIRSYVEIQLLQTSGKNKGSVKQTFKVQARTPNGISIDPPKKLFRDGKDIYSYDGFYTGKGALNGTFKRRLNADKWLDVKYLTANLLANTNELLKVMRQDEVLGLALDKIEKAPDKYEPLNFYVGGGLPAEQAKDRQVKTKYINTLNEALMCVSELLPQLTFQVVGAESEAAALRPLFNFPKPGLTIVYDPGYGTLDVAYFDLDGTLLDSETHNKLGVRNMQSGMTMGDVETNIQLAGAKAMPPAMLESLIITLSHFHSNLVDTGYPVNLYYTGGTTELLSSTDKARLFNMFGRDRVQIGTGFDNAKAFMIAAKGV